MPRPQDVTLTTFAGIKPAVRASERCTWADFVELRLPELVATTVRVRGEGENAAREAKKRLPGFVLAPVDGRRTDSATGAHTALVIDVDALPDNDLGALLKRAAHFRCVVYETPSSEDDAPRARVIAALSEPLDPTHVPAARRAFASALKLDPDACGTAGALPSSQVMFAGRLRGTRERGIWAYEGKIYAPPRVQKERTRSRANRQGEAEQSARIGRAVKAKVPKPDRVGAFDFDLPPDLSCIAKHVPPAGVDGDRHLLVRALGGWLARRGYAPAAIAEAVLYQIPASDPAERAAQAQDAAERVLRGEDAPGWEALERWSEGYARGAATLRRLERACRDPREPEGFGGGEDVWSEWWAGVWPRIEESFAARARERALAAASEDAPPPPPGAEQDGTGLHLHPASGWPWVLQKGDYFWLHSVASETYRSEVRACELIAAVARNMAGLLDEDDLTLETLRTGWVKPLDRIRATYTARTHTYDPSENTLTLAALRWSSRKPTRHKHIDVWLRALFGEGYPLAAQWIASLFALDRPAPCLYLPGPPGVGKSLLADGLAAIWSRPAAVDMAEAIDNFNSATGECPIVFTDEGFPEKMRFEKFRKMITEHSRRVNEKQRAKVDVEGCARLIIAANNEDVLRYQKIGTLTKDDLDAISERLLVVPCDASARAKVDALDTDAAASHEIAEHAAWLAETVALEPHGRMAAKPGGGERILASVIAGRSSDILVRIRECIGTGSMGERSGVGTTKKAPEEVHVNVTRLVETFGGRVTLGAVKECCDSFQLRPGTEQHKTHDGDNLRWRVLSRLRLDEAFAKLD